MEPFYEKKIGIFQQLFLQRKCFSIASFGSVRSDLGKYLCRELMSIWRLIIKYLYCSYTLHPGNNS